MKHALINIRQHYVFQRLKITHEFLSGNIKIHIKVNVYKMYLHITFHKLSLWFNTLDNNNGTSNISEIVNI